MYIMKIMSLLFTREHVVRGSASHFVVLVLVASKISCVLRHLFNKLPKNVIEGATGAT